MAENMSAGAIIMDRDTGMKDQQIRRRSFRRVLDPDPGEEATPEDRERVMLELRSICFYDKAFDVKMGTNDVGYQIAGMEGKRSVYLLVMDAIRMSRNIDQKEPQQNSIARVE
jgi:hypothetical protein